jgi:hypothetical protein
MIRSNRKSRAGNLTLRRLLLACVAVSVAFVAGCGPPAPVASVPFSPPDEFSDARGVWQRNADGPSGADNQLIGKFFKQKPDLLGSPDWTGQPEKYVHKDSNSRLRFYWLSGARENPSWNAIEIQGTRIRELNGIGDFGTITSDETN